MTEYLPLLTGFVTGGSLIIAIGAQNAFVMSQGARGQYPGQIALTCSVIDILLILAGVAGMGALIRDDSRLLLFVSLGGALFLSAYAYRSFRSLFHRDALKQAPVVTQTRWKVFVTTLALSLLNPHVYLDTLVLIGSIAASIAEPGKYWFAAGACMASVSWFFALSFGAQRLSPWLRRPRVWQGLEAVIGLIMSALAISLWTQGFALLR